MYWEMLPETIQVVLADIIGSKRVEPLPLKDKDIESTGILLSKTKPRADQEESKDVTEGNEAVA